MKLGENDYLMRQLFSPSFVRMGQKLRIFYYWPIFERVRFFLTQTLYPTLFELQRHTIPHSKGLWNVTSEQQKAAHIQKLAINKKSTIFVQSSWNLGKIIASWGNHFHQFTERLDQSCGFFINGQLLNVCRFLLLRL